MQNNEELEFISLLEQLEQTSALLREMQEARRLRAQARESGN